MTDILLIFFALPLATIILSIVLQKILNNPLLVAATIFSIFLIVTFVVGNLELLVATIIYTIISFITAFIVCIICRFFNRENFEHTSNPCSCTCNNQFNNLNDQNELLTINNNNNNNDDNNTTQIASNGISARINVVPNNNANSNCGYICGNYRRR